MENEKRLIDANAFQFEPDWWGGANGVICVGRSGGKTMATVLAALKCMIDNAPTVDAVEVKHGRWIRRIVDISAPYYTKDECSVCHWEGEVYYKYCPNCGAKMDGDGNA